MAELSRSPGGVSAALHGYSMHPLSTGRRALQRLEAHKGIPGAEELPGDRPEPDRKLLEPHEEPAEEGHLIDP